VASQLFWLVATLEVALSMRFALVLRNVAPPELSAHHFALATGQRKDSWLACAVIWLAILSKGCPIRSALLVTGALVLVWLFRRTVQRLRSLGRKL
jgi:cobalamin synthase